MQDQPGIVSKAVILGATLAGSVVGLMNNTSLTTSKQRVSFVMSGVICSYYLTGFLSRHFIMVTDPDAQSITSFLVGMFGAAIVQAAYKTISGATFISQLFGVIRGRLGL